MITITPTPTTTTITITITIVQQGRTPYKKESYQTGGKLAVNRRSTMTTLLPV